VKVAIHAALLFAALGVSSACQRPPAFEAAAPRLVLPGTDGAKHDLAEEARSARLLVLFFSAWTCPCQTVHDVRIRELYSRYHPLGVDVLAVDSETAGSMSRAKEEVVRRGYDFPVLLDAGGALARALGAQYATESFVLDPTGVVRYHGGVDSDRNELHDDARPYLQNALDDLLAGKSPRTAESKALGCSLQTW
jgi:peroxiredoxin